MELDELKILLKDQPAKMQLVKSTGEIAALMGNKTRSVTGKLRRSLKIEIISCIVFAVLCVAFGIFGSYTSLRIYFSIFAVACLLFLPFLFMLLKKTTKLSSTVLPVKSNLQNLLKIMQEFVNYSIFLHRELFPGR
ncbi:MAG TPA: hypothetical protein PLA68_11435 [Panacibacter sp.]|nr:hypothetical protein [Panacibacter sp.]